MRNDRLIIGITMGDAAGIGPEIIDKALSLEELHKICRPVVIGDAKVLSEAQKVAQTHLDVRPIRGVSHARFSPAVMNVIDLANISLTNLKLGQPQAMAGKASYEYVEKAVDLALAREINAITTAPISKEALRMGGFHYPGHTEILADLTHSEKYAMMFVAGDLRVILVTIHVSLRESKETEGKQCVRV